MPYLSDLAGVTNNFSVSGQISTTGGILSRVVTLTDAATVTINIAITDIGILLSLSQAVTFANPTGTPVDGQLLQIRISSLVSRSISFATAYQGASSLGLPQFTTGGGADDYIAFRYNATDVKYDLIGTTIGAAPIVALRTAVALVNFTTPSRGQFFTVAVASAIAGNRVVCSPSLVMPVGVAEDELECDPIDVYGSCTVNGSVRLFVYSVLGGILGGQRNINLLIG